MSGFAGVVGRGQDSPPSWKQTYRCETCTAGGADRRDRGVSSHSVCST